MNISKWSTIDWVLFIIAVFDVVFVIAMIVIFCNFQAIPDTLIVVVGACTFGECGFCRSIYKDRKNREVSKEDSASEDEELG